MDDFDGVLAPRKHRRFLRIRARRVDYKPLLHPPVKPESQCPHTTQVLEAAQCSQCRGVKADRVRPLLNVSVEE